jgi:hypothetical protein
VAEGGVVAVAGGAVVAAGVADSQRLPGLRAVHGRVVVTLAGARALVATSVLAAAVALAGPAVPVVAAAQPALDAPAALAVSVALAGPLAPEALVGLGASPAPVPLAVQVASELERLESVVPVESALELAIFPIPF